jgi:hypothetical protein
MDGAAILSMTPETLSEPASRMMYADELEKDCFDVDGGVVNK